jgi:integrase
MGRPLTGSIRRTATGYTASLPAQPGSTRRASAHFTLEGDAQRWLAAAVANRRAHLPLPAAPTPVTPAAGRLSRYRSGPATGTPTVRAAEPTAPTAPDPAPASEGRLSFRAVADHWHHEYFIGGGHAGAGRAKDVERLLTVLTKYFEAENLRPGTLTRDHYVSILEQWAGRRSGPLNKRVPRDSADGTARGYARDLLAQHRRVLDAVLTHAWKVHHQPQLFAPDTFKTPATTAVSAAPKRPITLQETALLAADLHAVHQLALWLLRVLGLRISEAFGLRVADLHRLPDQSGRGLLVVTRQGGRPFEEYDEQGRTVPVNEVDRTKTTQSVRLVPVPATLMRLLDLTVAAFHTGPDGTVDERARLIPDLSGAGSGQMAFRAALAAAARRAGVDVSSAVADDDGSLVPHDLRKALVTDIAAGQLSDWVRQRYVGHRAGDDVHHGVYILDDPAARPLLAVADHLQHELDHAVPRGLVITTTKRCTTGNQPALAPRAAEIDAALLDAHWLAAPAASAEPVLDAGAVAELLAIAPTTARRYLANGTLPSRPLPGGRRDQRGALLSDVQALRSALDNRTTMADLADQLGYSIASLHGAARRRGLALELQGNLTVVPDPTRRALVAWASQQNRLKQTAYPQAEAARRLGVSARTVHHMVDAGILESVRATDTAGDWVTRDSVEASLGRAPRGRRRAHVAG